jgi:ribosomal protein L17
MAIKKSVKARIKKDRENQVKHVNSIVRQALMNYDFLSTLITEGNSEETYHKIMDFREAVESMVNDFKEEDNKKGEA